LREAVARAVSEITCARGLLPPGAALNHLNEADGLLCSALAAGSRRAETNADSAQCEASQSGPKQRNAQGQSHE
jgi:hypothetical protein